MSISVSLKRVSALAAAVAFVFSAFAVTTASAQTVCSFTLSHKQGQTGGEIMAIQKFLNSNGFVIAATGAGSPGSETSYFGSRTKAAVQAFQAAKGVSPVSGYWGPLTRAAANAHCASGPVVTPGPTTPATGNAVVSAAAQPGNSLAPQSAARVPFTKFTVTAGATPVTLNSVTVERGGLAADSAFSGVILLDDTGAQLGNSQTLNSNHQATVGAPVVIPAGASKTFTVAANMNSTLTANAGQVAVLSVVAVNTNGTIAGSLPITGAQHTINASLSLGSISSVTVSSFDPNGAQSKNIGDTGVRMAGIRVQAGSTEDLRFWGVRFRMNGSASASDLSNIKVNIDGTEYDGVWSTDGRYVSVMVPGGLKIEKGFAKDIYVKADITGTNASGRVAEFDIDKTTDIYFTGELYGYGITPPAGTGTVSTAATHGSAVTNGQPWFQGSTISISGASVTSIAKASEVPAANVAVNVPNVVLGGFVTDIKGEPLTVQTIPLKVVYSVARASTAPLNIAPASQVLTNVTIVDENGAVVSGPTDETYVSATEGTITLSNSVTFPTGRKVYTVKGKIHQAVALTGGTVTMGTAPKASATVLAGWTTAPQWSNVTGQLTGNTITLTVDSFNMNAMTIKAASLAATLASTPTAQTQVAGGTDIHFATFRFDASNSGEDVRFANVPVTFATPGNLSSCRLYDGATNLTTGGNVISTPAATGSFVLDNSIVVTKGTIKSLDVKCNILGSATGTSNVGLAAPSGITATGVVSNNTITVSGAATTGPVMSIGLGQAVLSLDASSPSLALSAGGTTGVNLGVMKIRAANEPISLQKLGLTLTGSTANVSNVTIWNGSTQVAGPFVFTAANQQITLTTPVTLPKDTDVMLTFKGDIASIGGSNAGVSHDNVAITWDSTAANNQFTGVSSGSNIPSQAATATNTVNSAGLTVTTSGVRIYKSIPTIADDSAALSSTGMADGKLVRFKVTANSAGSVGVGQLSFTVTTSAGVTVTAPKLYAYTDAGYSVPASSTGSSDGQFGAAAANLAAASTTSFKIVPSATNPVQVGAGQTVYFELRGALAGAATGASVTTTVNGDASAVAAGTVSGLAAANNFLWTPNTNGTAVTTDTAFHNGANIVGLPSGGFVKSRGL